MSFATTTSFLPLLSYTLLLLLVSTSSAKDHSDGTDASQDITWQQPVSGTIFKTGDNIIAQWSSEREVVSPSFMLCEYSTNSRRRSPMRADKRVLRLAYRRGDNCGAKVWPIVQPKDSNSFIVSLVAPEVSAQKTYYMLIQDDFGSLMQSPSFSVSPQQESASDVIPTSTTLTGVVDSSPTPGSGENKGTSISSTTGASADSVTSSTSGNGSGTASAQAAQGPQSQQNTTSTMNSTNKPPLGIPKGPIYVDPSNLLTHNRPAPVAAFAIPLSAVAAALLIAGGLALRHRRALRKEREQDKLTIKILDKLRGPATLCAPACAPPTLPANAPQLPPIQIQPVPLFMPMPVPVSMEQASTLSVRQSSSLGYPETGEARQSTRQAFTYQSPLGHVASYKAMGRPHRSDASAPISSSSPRSRTLSTSAYSSKVQGIEGCSSVAAPYLPPLSFSSCLSSMDLPHSTDGEGSTTSNSCTTSDVLEDYYCLPSPDSPQQYSDFKAVHSPIKPPPLPPSLISAPQRLHIRDEVPSSASNLSHTSNGNSSQERTPSRVPTPAGNLYAGQRDVYAIVATLLAK